MFTQTWSPREGRLSLKDRFTTRGRGACHPLRRRSGISCGLLDSIVNRTFKSPLKHSVPAEIKLLEAIRDTQRGLSTSASHKQEILNAVEELESIGRGTVTTNEAINATWKLLWTTEKETLFILKNARWFGTEAGDVYQVIDVAGGSLNNVITFPPDGAFIVDSSLEVGGDQRLYFKFTGAELKLTKRTLTLPPFGKGWFDTVYLGRSIRVAKDIRGDTLVVERDGPPRSFGATDK